MHKTYKYQIDDQRHGNLEILLLILFTRVLNIRLLGRRIGFSLSRIVNIVIHCVPYVRTVCGGGKSAALAAMRNRDDKPKRRTLPMLTLRRRHEYRKWMFAVLSSYWLLQITVHRIIEHKTNRHNTSQDQVSGPYKDFTRHALYRICEMVILKVVEER